MWFRRVAFWSIRKLPQRIWSLFWVIGDINYQTFSKSGIQIYKVGQRVLAKNIVISHHIISCHTSSHDIVGHIIYRTTPFHASLRSAAIFHNKFEQMICIRYRTSNFTLHLPLDTVRWRWCYVLRHYDVVELIRDPVHRIHQMWSKLSLTLEMLRDFLGSRWSFWVTSFCLTS